MEALKAAALSETVLGLGARKSRLRRLNSERIRHVGLQVYSVGPLVIRQVVHKKSVVAREARLLAA